MTLTSQLPAGYEHEQLDDATSEAEGYFLLLCAADLQSRYRAVFASLPYRVVSVETPEDMLIWCLKSPPMAVFIDLRGLTRMGALVTGPLFELGMHWPVMRCALQADGSANVLCMEPARCGSMVEAMQSIASRDAAWRSSRWHRCFLRVDLQCRVRMLVPGEEQSRVGNTANLSVGGAFVVSYEAPEAGTVIDLEIHDLAEEPLCVKAQVVWSRDWSHGPEFPGLALAFLPESITPELRAALGRPENVNRLQRQ